MLIDYASIIYDMLLYCYMKIYIQGELTTNSIN